MDYQKIFKQHIAEERKGRNIESAFMGMLFYLSVVIGN
jgi:hypothetical protein